MSFAQYWQVALIFQPIRSFYLICSAYLFYLCSAVLAIIFHVLEVKFVNLERAGYS